MKTLEELRELQALPLEAKILKTHQRIREWVDHFGEDGCYIAFSGGKDSTVLLHIVRELYPNIPAIFVDTGLEYPEIKEFVKKFDNVETLRPELTFKEVIKKYGYPMISKEASGRIYYARKGSPWAFEKISGTYKGRDGNLLGNSCKKYIYLVDADFVVHNACCNVMKKAPLKKYCKKTGRHGFVGSLAEESRMRQSAWLHQGCNAFNATNPSSTPLAFWTEQDILNYIQLNNLEIASVYGEIIQNTDGEFVTTGTDRTGCVFCGFGLHLEDSPTRFQKLKETHPALYDYCLRGGEHNEEGVWVPSQDGLGMKHVFDEMNRLYGEIFIRYK